MADDRTLLEKAAKAAGIGLWTEWEDGGPTGRYRIGADGDTWNPLTDDGDALRLAVKCFLVIDIGPVSVSVHENNGRHDIGFEWRGDDPNAATRRAIVRAAAALSESP